MHPVVSLHLAPGKSAQKIAVDFAYDVAKFWDRELGRRLIGIYLIGSLAHGGFSARYSDIDMALIAEGPLECGEIDLVNREVGARSDTLASRLSLFWTNQYFSVGRFPPLDRVDYIDHGVTLLERRHVCPARPTLAEIRTYLGAEPFRNWSQQVQRLIALDELTISDHKHFLRALLYPARFLYSWETGAIGSNDEAVAFLQSRAPEIDLDVITRALHCRNQGEEPQPLFPERSRLLQLRDMCEQLIAAEHED
jgi:predicted nucleotidyltransferase